MSDFPLLDVNEAVQDLAMQFITKSNLPPKAADDAIHMAVSTIYGTVSGRKIISESLRQPRNSHNKSLHPTR